jgi:predicted RNase H-related nuclease YkuK (DUF458 family)
MKIKVILFLIVMALLLHFGNANLYAAPNEAPDVEWTKTFGGDDRDEGYSVQQTKDGGYIIAGETSSFGAEGRNIWLIKTDAQGNKIWDKTFFAGWNKWLFPSVQQTTDDGYIIVGSKAYTTEADDLDEACDVWLIKTDAKGNKLWDKTFDKNDSDFGDSVQQTSDGGYIIKGETEYSTYDDAIWLIKTDGKGNKVWDKTFKTFIDENGVSYKYFEGGVAQQTKDGGYIVSGYVYSEDDYDKEGILLFKTDDKGNKLWEKIFGVVNDESDTATSVQQTTDGGYIVVGTKSYGNGYPYDDIDVLLIKTDVEGNKEWDKTFSGNNYSSGDFVQQTKDGGYIISGTGEDEDRVGILLMKTDDKGNKLWDKIFVNGDIDISTSVQQTKDGGYIVVGSIRTSDDNWDILLIKVKGE